jgi:predicted negative regulator of RcsB-dependent stress response
LAIGRIEDAATVLDQALRRAPGDADIAESLGDALWRLGDRRRARYMWSRALNRQTDDEERAGLVGKLESGLVQAP